MTALMKRADVFQVRGPNHFIRVSWSLYGEAGCLVRAVLLSLSYDELDEHTGGVAPVEIESPSSCSSELVIEAWTQFRDRIIDKGSSFFLSLSEAIDEMEKKLRKL
jgi:hypothetical protein